MPQGIDVFTRQEDEGHKNKKEEDGRSQGRRRSKFCGYCQYTICTNEQRKTNISLMNV